MNIGILGYGKEGQSAEQYFRKQNATIKIFDNFTIPELQAQDFSKFDLIFRSPSVHPHKDWSSMTKYFFDHCPCQIIGVTGTKGKGTTCSILTNLLKNLHQDVYLVGNIGNPALDILDQLTPNSVVVYELSSFQLWDLEKSPNIAIILGIEPDHLNIHDDFNDYINAKANICRHQDSKDTCIYFKNNSDTTKIANIGSARKIAYPLENPELTQTVKHLSLPGQHNQENAEAAIIAAASFLNLSINDFLVKFHDIIIKTLENFQGLPHRLQFLRELNGIKYYDDNFSTTPTSLEVALKSFPNKNIVLIAGGRDKTNNQDLPEIVNIINQNNVIKTILIGESGHELTKLLPSSELAADLPSAVALARASAEQLHANIVLMSPSAASFDMFSNVYDRGTQFQKLIQDLK